MPIFYPQLEESKNYDASFDTTRPEFAKIKNDFKLCFIFHKLHIDPHYLENPNILDWFDFVIVHPQKGTVCITNSYIYNDETNVLTGRIPGRIDFAEDLEEAKKIFENWSNVGNYEYDKTVDLLKEIMQINSLPSVNFKQMSCTRDKRFTEISTQYGLVKDVEDLIKMETDKSKEVYFYAKTCAGSGKTIAAIHAYNRLRMLGKKPLFICYNHLLGNLLPKAVDNTQTPSYVGTLYKFASWKLYEHFETINVTHPPHGIDYVDVLLEELKLGKVTSIEKYDALIVDEGQDFKDYWVELLTYYLKPDASVLWFEDKNQNILLDNYDDKYSGLYSIQAGILNKINMLHPKNKIDKKPNYRATKFIEDFLINFFLQYKESKQYKESINPRKSQLPFNYDSQTSEIRILGRKPEINFYEKGGLLEKLKERIDHLKNKDHIELNDIEIISCLPDSIEDGSSSSYSLLFEKKDDSKPYQYILKELGGYSLKRLTGEYENGRKVYKNDNGILCESITRYKGMESPVVLVIDVEQPDDFYSEEWIQLLYCALTRAKMHMEIFVCNDGNMKELFEDVNEISSKKHGWT